MLNISLATSVLKSLGEAGSMALNSAKHAEQSNETADPEKFLHKFRSALAELSKESAADVRASFVKPIEIESKFQSTLNIEKTKAESTVENGEKKSNAVAPFDSFEEFRTWEKDLGGTFSKDYKTPDYIHMMGLSRIGGNDDAFKRYVFFKNNPAFAIDYENIHDGKLSSFPTDGSTLVKSDLSAMPADISEFYKKNPDQLRLAEGFNMDPTLYKMRLDGKVDIPLNTNVTEWLTQNKWTPEGVVASSNRVEYARREYIGLDGEGAGTYQLAKYNTATGNIIDLDGSEYDPVTGKAAA